MANTPLDLIAILNLENLAPDTQSAFLAECADSIFSTAMVRFEPLLSSPDQEALDEVLQGDPEPDELLKYLVDTYPAFTDIVRAVSAEFQTEYRSRTEADE